DRTYMVYPLYLVELFDNPVETADTVSIMRFQGVYDEAGLLGTILAFFIYTLGYNFKNWRTWACIIVGVFTFSFFFYTMTVVFWAVNAIVRKKRAYSFVFALVLFGGFYLMTKDSTMFQDVIWNRFEWNTENSSFEGDNRMTEEGEAEYNKIKGTSEYWLGLKAEHAKSFWASAEGSSSYKAVVANKGMVFFAIYTLFILLLGWYNRSTKESFLLYAVFMIVCIYQRTNVYSVLFLFLYSALARLQLGRGDLLRP
ncbi:MAG: hypothetical protein J5771_03855, partial [Bacteroidales bacterium]|nr:hypothetical protein [Bacteroidales bacterium]